MSSVKVRPFRRSDRDQLTQLVNSHAGAVVPGMGVSVNTVLTALERRPEESIEDPWVSERLTLVAEQQNRVAAAAHLLRYFPDERAGSAARDAGEIHWLLFWPHAPAGNPCWPDATQAAEALMAACILQLAQWGVTRQQAGGELPVRGVYGVPDQWPHISALYQRTGFTHTGHTEIIYLATVEDLPRPAEPPLPGLSVSRTAGMNGTRLAATLAADVIGYLEVETFADGARLSRHGGWAEIGNLHVTPPYRRLGVATWLLGQAADWLQLARATPPMARRWRSRAPAVPSVGPLLTQAGARHAIELTKHVSLRQLDPLALLSLRITGSCTVTVPEWLYDRDCPGHYLRRIKTVSLSVPSVVGPYTSVNCTLSLQSSSLRTSPLLANGVYARSTTQDDDRFTDYFGSTDIIVTSTGTNDSGMFETNLRDERFLPFEGAGAISTWTLALPKALRPFDYTTISDVVIHLRYTAREAGDPLGSQATTELLQLLSPGPTGSVDRLLLFCLRYDFPTQWSAFVNGSGFQVTIDKSYFPYAAQDLTITVTAVTLYADGGEGVISEVAAANPDTLTQSLKTTGQAVIAQPADAAIMIQDEPARQVFLVLRYRVHA